MVHLTGRWFVKNIKPTANGEAQEVKIKVRINLNGVIQLTSANLVEKKAKEEAPVDNGNAENSMDVTQEVCMAKKTPSANWRSCLEFFAFMILNPTSTRLQRNVRMP